MTRYPNNEQRGDPHIDTQPDEYELDEQQRLAGCVACGLWDKDEDGRLMCCCGPTRYAQMHGQPNSTA